MPKLYNGLLGWPVFLYDQLVQHDYVSQRLFYTRSEAQVLQVAEKGVLLERVEWELLV